MQCHHTAKIMILTYNTNVLWKMKCCTVTETEVHDAHFSYRI